MLYKNERHWFISHEWMTEQHYQQFYVETDSVDRGVCEYYDDVLSRRRSTDMVQVLILSKDVVI